MSSYHQKIKFALLVVSLIIIIIPTNLYAQQRYGRRYDRYLRNVLRGSLEYRYTIKTDKFDKVVTNRRKTFEQLYGLSLSGHIWDVRFMIYDQELTIKKEKVFDESYADVSRYRLRTTMFPMFRFPLSLYFSRTAMDSNETKGWNMNYGLNWQLNFRRSLTANLSLDKSESTNSADEITYGMQLRKVFRKRNSFRTLGLRAVKSKGAGSESREYNIGLSNTTRMSKTTTLTFDGAYTLSEKFEDSIKNRDRSFSINSKLSFRPSKQLFHEYTYRFSDYKIGSSDSTNQRFFADLTYKLSEKTTIYESLSITYSKSLSIEGVKRSRTSGRLRSGVNHRLTKSISTSAAFFYTDSKTFPKTSDTEETSRKEYGLTTGIGYGRSIGKWLRFNTGYSITYKRFKSKPFGKGSSTEHRYKLELNIDLSKTKGFKYLTITPSYEFVTKESSIKSEETRIHRFGLDIDSTYLSNRGIHASYRYKKIIEKGNKDRRSTHTFALTAVNTSLIPGTTIKGIYRYKKISEKIAEDRSEHTFKVATKGTYFRRVRAETNIDYRLSYESGRKSRFISYGAKVGYSFLFLRSPVYLNAQYNNASSKDTSGDLSKSSTLNLDARYIIVLNRATRLSFRLENTLDKQDKRDSTHTQINAKLERILGSWFITVTFERDISRPENNKPTIKDEVMFSIKRRFIRVF